MGGGSYLLVVLILRFYGSYTLIVGWPQTVQVSPVLHAVASCALLAQLPYFAEVKQGGKYIKFHCHCLSAAKMSQSAK